MNHANDFGLADFLASLERKGYSLSENPDGGLHRIIEAVAPVSDKAEDFSLAVSHAGRLRGVRSVSPGIRARELIHSEGSNGYISYIRIGIFGDDITTYSLNGDSNSFSYLGIVLSRGYNGQGEPVLPDGCAELVHEATLSAYWNGHRKHDVAVHYLPLNEQPPVFRLLAYHVPDNSKPMAFIARDERTNILVPSALLMGKNRNVNDDSNIQNIEQGENPTSLSFDYYRVHISAVEKCGALEVMIEDRSSAKPSAEQVAVQLQLSRETCAAFYAAAMSSDGWLDLQRDFPFVQAFSIREN